MARVVLHHRKTVRLDVVLDRSSDIEQGIARLDLGQALEQRFLGTRQRVWDSSVAPSPTQRLTQLSP
jgi:hypothetical protein